MITVGFIWLLAYILGSLPFGVWLARSRSVDLRQHGSGNIGATNVARTLGKKAGLLVLLADGCKGVVSVAIADQALATSWEVGTAGLMAFLGHLFSVFLKFKGGKGVAVGLGVFLYLMPFAALSAIAVFAVAIGFSKYVSIGSMTAALAIPLFGALYTAPLPYIYLSMIIALIVIWKHKDNIRRLVAGEEGVFLRK